MGGRFEHGSQQPPARYVNFGDIVSQHWTAQRADERQRHKVLHMFTYAGASAASNDPSDGRHGDGQTLANNLFRQYVADSVARYKNFNEDGSSAGPGDAEKGISHFLADPDRSKVGANHLMAWACLLWVQISGMAADDGNAAH